MSAKRLINKLKQYTTVLSIWQQMMLILCLLMLVVFYHSKTALAKKQSQYKRLEAQYIEMQTLVDNVGNSAMGSFDEILATMTLNTAGAYEVSHLSDADIKHYLKVLLDKGEVQIKTVSGQTQLIFNPKAGI